MTDTECLEELKALGEKYAKATEQYDSIIEVGFVKMKDDTQKIANQIGNEILQIIGGLDD